MYTYESLEVLTKDSLMKLAGYNGVPDVNMKMLKGDMIKAIIEYMKPKEVKVNGDNPPASVRIQRIRESQEK